MKNFDELSFEERKEIVELFSNWLKGYTYDVIIKVLEKRNEIINNDFAINLLIELKKREEKEEKDFKHSIGCLINQFDEFKEFNPHNHPLTHSNSYRDILYDMFIR